MKNLIVAYDNKFGIGANNDLLWVGKLPADLKHFKDTTTGHSIIMGFNTYLSIGRPLPNRRNIVISNHPIEIPGFEVVDSLENAFKLTDNDAEVFVIGGGKIYAEAVNLVNKIFATEVDAVFNNAAVFFPSFDKLKWHEISREKHFVDEDNHYNYDFVVYERS